MSVTYLLALSEPQADALLKGYDVVAGFAVDAAAAANITDIGELMDLLCLRFPGSPYREDQPLNILHLPADPFIQARHAVGPLHPDAFQGGVIEGAPYDGSGVARGGGVETDLLLLDPCRISSGARMWRFHPGNPKPELRGIYHGLTYGWEDVAAGTFTAGVPTQFLGPVILRSWGPVPCDVEYDADGPHAVTMVSPIEPSQEEGFEKVESGIWAKRISYEPDMMIYTDIIVGSISGIPVRVVRGVKSKDEFYFQVVSLLPDAPFCMKAGFQRWSTGTFTTLVKPENLVNQKRQQAKPNSWDMTDRPAITAIANQKNDVTDNQILIQSIFNLINQTVLPNYDKSFVRVQLVGHSAMYEAAANLKDGRSAQMKVIPTALVHLLRRFKQNRVLEGEPPFYTAVLQLDADTKKGSLNINADEEPKWASDVPHREWRRELSTFPRKADDIPEWMFSHLAGGEKTVDIEVSKTGSPFPADLTEGIKAGGPIIGNNATDK